MHRPTFCTFLSASPVRAFYPALGQPQTKGNTAQFPPRGLSTAPQLRHGIYVAKMLDNVGLRYPHRASGAKAPRTLRPLPLLRFAVSATGGAHLCSIQYYLRFWFGICRTSLAVSALRIMRYCPNPTALLYSCPGFLSNASNCFTISGSASLMTLPER